MESLQIEEFGVRYSAWKFLLTTIMAAVLATLTTVRQLPAPVEPLAEECGPRIANIVCINHYTVVIPNSL